MRLRRAGKPWADPGAGGQRAVHPAQTDLVDFHPAIAHRRQVALFECPAAAVCIQQREVAMGGAWTEQCFEKAHDCVPGSLHAAKIGSLP